MSGGFRKVLHCSLHLLVFTRCAVVLDANNQDVLKNKYCSQIGECTPGTHTVCRFGSDPNTMGPRCAEGKALQLQDLERDFFLEVFNGFRSDLASGKEIQGKDNITLPQAGGMRKLSWDFELEKFARIWANQCVDRRRDLCRSMDQYPRAGQMVGNVPFRYPDWSIANKKFIDESPGLTLEKRRHAIERFAKIVYDTRKVVTPSMIAKSVGSGHENVYLMAVYGPSIRIGCAMSTFLDFRMSFQTPTKLINLLVVVCNFSSRPEEGKPVYNGTAPCGCPEGFKNENCLCVLSETTEKPAETDVKVDVGKESKEESDEHKIECPMKRPAVVVLPIITVEDADAKLYQTKIRKRIENARDCFFKTHGFDPNTRFSNGGPVDQDSLVISQFHPDHSNPYVNRKARGLELTYPTNLHIQIKPKLEITKLDENVYHEHQNHNEGSKTDEANRIYNDMINNAAAKVYVSSINGKPVQYPFENFRKSLRPSTRTLPYGIQSFSNQGEPKIYVTSINGKPMNFHYHETFKKSHKTNPNTDSTYDEHDFSYKGAPYMTIPNDYHDQLFNALKTPGHNFKDIAYNSYIDELAQENLRTTGEDITDKGNVVVKSTKQIQKADVADNIGSKVFSTDNIANENYYLGQLFNALKTLEQQLKDIAYNSYIDELAQENLRTTGEDITDKGNVEVKSTKQIQKGDVADSIGSKVFSADNIENENYYHGQLFNALKTLEQQLKDIAYNSYIDELAQKNLRTTGEDIPGKDNVVVKSTKQIQEGDVADNIGSNVFYTDNIENENYSHGQLFNALKTPEQQLKNIAYNSYIHELTPKNLRTTGEDITDKGNVVVKSTKQIQKGDVADNIGFKVFSTVNNDNKNDYHVQLFNGLKTPEQELKDNIAYNSYIDQMARKNLRRTGENITEKGNVVVKSTNQIQKDDLADSIGFKVYFTDNIDSKPRTIEAQTSNLPTKNQTPLHIHAYGAEKGNLVVKSTKKIQKGDLADNIGSKIFSTDNIDNEQRNLKAEMGDWPTRNQIPLYIHAYGTNNFDYYKHFHATKEYIKPRATILNNENDIRRNNGDTKDKPSNGNNRRQKIPFLYDITKIINYYLRVLNHLQSSKHDE